jgi:ParB/RepB/Spo0J family partition protein
MTTTTTTTAAKFANDHVPLDAIHVVSNVRHRHPAPTDDDVRALAASIRESGLINPPTVRLVGGAVEPRAYELVAGARRLAAVRSLGWATCPVRVMTDDANDAADMVALVENLQRRALQPMEEARAIADMLGRAPAADVAERLGFTVPFVVRTAQLTALLPVLAEAFEAGRLTRGAAVALARCTPALQEQWTDDVLERTSPTDPEPESAVDGWLCGDLRDLAVAPWSLHDALLVPAAGSCAACPKSTASTPGLFDEPGVGRCMDAACYAAKGDAHVLRAFENAAPDAVAFSEFYAPGRVATARAAGVARSLVALSDVERTAKGAPKQGRVVGVVVESPNVARLGLVLRLRLVAREAAPGAAALPTSAGAAAVVAERAKAERDARKDERAQLAAVAEAAVEAVTADTDLTLLVGVGSLTGAGTPALDAARRFGCVDVPAVAYASVGDWAACLKASPAVAARRLVAWAYAGAGGAFGGRAGLKWALKDGALGRLATHVGVDGAKVAADALAALRARRKAKAAPKARAAGGRPSKGKAGRS